jgi:hypothetical protein
MFLFTMSQVYIFNIDPESELKINEKLIGQIYFNYTNSSFNLTVKRKATQIETLY